ncbi:hypothetical protein [Mobilicoccus pelagius]|uniref:Uncharacterized protein n=1 Tax=Mobilicoccus pelagius NBRC 104925 TaxID=1089455 RepID=H5UTD8_9MICO|nr:hypothetical protein [Mobilicoccus pelagius]GAB48996.1 hypothetical protein MOPEL_096_00030 [Mobilicoccus pelagius NBRC 104925]
MSTPGRFTSAATRTPTAPVGVSAREGRILTAWAMFQLVVLAVVFQAANLPVWGGIFTFVALAVFLLGQVGLSSRVARHRRVHPRGFNGAARGAGIWAVLVVAVAGWFWIAQGPHASPWWATSFVALLAVAPSLILALRLTGAARTEDGRR